MIKILAASNFKAFGPNVEVSLAPITLIYGQNSAGKSSIIQALLLLKQTLAASSQVGGDIVEPRLMPRGDLVDLGSFLNLVNRHNKDALLKLGIQFERVVGTVPAFRVEPDDVRTAEFVFEWDQERLSVINRTMTVGIGDAIARFMVLPYPSRPRLPSVMPRRFQLADSKSATRLASWLAAHPSRFISPDDHMSVSDLVARLEPNKRISSRLFRGRGFFPRSTTPGREDAAFTPYRMQLDRFLRTVETEFDSLFSQMAYLGPLRAPPARFNEYTGQEYGSVGTSGEFTAELLVRSPEVIQELNLWFKRLQIPYTLKVETIAESEMRLGIGDLIAMTLTETRGQLNVTPRDVGFGISQLLPIVVQLLLSRHRVICIEQPEIHVHPKLQANLADLFVATSRRPGNQVIVETHSEHLILRLQRRVREGKLDCEDVSVLYVEKDKRGRARVTRLRLDEYGSFIDEWPGGFFPERLEELD